MKKIITPLVGPKGRKDILLRLEKLEERVSLLENAPTNEDEQEVVVEDEFTPIQVADDCYIKSTDAETFGINTIGTHVYSDESCETPAADGEYSFYVTGLEDYSEETGVSFGLPEIASFTVVNGVITATAAQEEEVEPKE